MQTVLILQGGAGRAFTDKKRPARIHKKISRILNLAYEKLLETDAREAVTYAVRLLEDDSEFNAGTGSQLQADGVARLSASIMDGARERFAGVINIEWIKNPILVARALLEEKDRILCAKGAFEFARKLGLKSEDPRTAESIRRWKQWKQTSPSLRGAPEARRLPAGEAGSNPRSVARLRRSRGDLGIASPPPGARHDGRRYDTVGACALDKFGHLASATSTGGRGFEWPGRVSDSGMPVANYADRNCAVSATGIGEEIIEEGLAVKIAVRVSDGMSLNQAFKKTFAEVQSRHRKMGAIGLDRKGRIALAHTTKLLIYGWRKGNERRVF